jgi:hypothetical protein
VSHPDEPWELRGQLHASALLVPLADVPVDLPPGTRPVRLGRFGVVGVAWVSYEPGGVLSYSELMATLLVRQGLRLRPTIVRIWVDSVVSRDGGRALWGIPKELADFDGTGPRWSARDEKGPIAEATVRPGRRLPGRWPVGFSVVQTRQGAAKVSRVRARAGLATARVSLAPDPHGPLAFLAGRSPLVSFSLRDFRMRFGG